MINTYDYQVAHPDHFKQYAVKDLLFLYYKCPQEEKKVNLYTHYNKIIYVLDGRKTLHRFGKSWELTKDTCYLIRKSAYSQERFYDTDWEVLCFYLPDNYLRQVFQEYRSRQSLKPCLDVALTDMLIPLNVNESTRAFFYSIVPYFSQPSSPSESLLQLKFRELLMNMLENPLNVGLTTYLQNLSDNYKPSLHEIMEANYTFHLSLAEFARICQRSLATFNREFREYYQTTPGQWLNQRRLEYARTLLNMSNKNIKEIAYDCGFENPTHFSRVFKDRYGSSPLHHRKQKASFTPA